MDRRLWLLGCLIAAIVAAGGAVRAASERHDALETLAAPRSLPVLAQQLMSALPGDSTVWKRHLSDRAVYVSEAGEVATKRELLGGFGGFPPGLAGSIEVRNVRITEHGDVAIVVFDAHEQQTVYDQHIEVDYVSTHAWRREKGRWQLIAAQAVVVAKDPPALPIRAERLDAYAGTYVLSGRRRYRVERRGDALVGGREGGELKPLIAVGDNVFADAGSNLGVLRIFVAGADGKVERMVQRRKFADLSWTRVPG